MIQRNKHTDTPNIQPLKKPRKKSQKQSEHLKKAREARKAVYQKKNDCCRKIKGY